MRWRKVHLWRWVAQWLVAALSVQWMGQSVAQAPGAPPAIKRVLILDFEVPAGQSPLLGRKVADAVALGFINYAKGYEVVSRSEMESQMQRLRLTPPLSPSQLIQLTRAVQARYAITGKIVQVQVNERAGQATVQLQMLWFDPYMEVPTNGAHVRVTSPPRPGTAPDVLVDQALNLAAAQAVQQALAVRLPEGQITQRVGNLVIINKGTDQGLRPRMEMWVVRTVRDPELGQIPQRVGRVILETVEARTAEARILEEATPVQYPDRVVAVYQLPPLGVPEAPVRVRPPSRGTQIAQVILVLLGVFFVANLMRRGNTNRGEGVAPSPTRAQVTEDGQRVILTLSSNRDTVAIEIYRDTSPAVNLNNLIEVVDPQAGTIFSDDQTFYSGRASIQIQQTGQQTGQTLNILPRLQREITTSTTAPVYQPQQYQVFFQHTPLQPGVSYWYVVRFVTARRVAINPFPTPTGAAVAEGNSNARPLSWSIAPSRPPSVLRPLCVGYRSLIFGSQTAPRPSISMPSPSASCPQAGGHLHRPSQRPTQLPCGTHLDHQLALVGEPTTGRSSRHDSAPKFTPLRPIHRQHDGTVLLAGRLPKFARCPTPSRWVCL
jgi:hypothetical protein